MLGIGIVCACKAISMPGHPLARSMLVHAENRASKQGSCQSVGYPGGMGGCFIYCTPPKKFAPEIPKGRPSHNLDDGVPGILSTNNEVI